MRALRHLLLIAAVAAIAWGGLLHAEEKEVFEPGTGKYVLVLRDPNTDTPDPKTKKKAPEPDLAKHGGKLLFKDKTSRIIKLPTAAAKALRKEENVAYLQRVWLGESLDGWEQTEGANMDATLKTPVESDALNLTWTTGTFSYDGSGNIKAIGANTYAYDKASRLSQASINGVSETYKYDSFGNLTERATAGQPHVIRVESSSNRLTGESYDAAGNVTTRNLKPAYSYDSLNQMDQIVTPLNSDRRMIYGPDEERIGVIIDPALSRWKIRDFDGRVLREFEDTLPDVWQWREDYVYEEGRVIGAERLPYYGGKRHFHTDHLGSVRMITNDQHMRIGMHDYYPFGLEQTSVIQSYVPNTPFWEESAKFTGHERDYNGYGNWDNTDYLDYMHARYYDPGVGRFLSVDPVLNLKQAMRSPQMWNRYSYAFNNPLVFTDPTGQIVYLVTYTTGNANSDDELRRAALTRAAEIKKQKGFDSKKDTVLVRGVGTVGDFNSAVKEANALAPKYGQVGSLSLFSHAGRRDGPQFHDGSGNESYLDWTSLGKMSVNWAPGATASFYGCNTSRSGFAQAFADAQGVSTYGFGRYSYFSFDPSERAAVRSTGPVYMIDAMGQENFFLPIIGGVIGRMGADARPMERSDPGDD